MFIASLANEYLLRSQERNKYSLASANHEFRSCERSWTCWNTGFYKHFTPPG